MNNPDQTQLISVAVAIIYQSEKFLMQLRDDLPQIAYPGVWGFFGGHLEPGESAETGLRRELIEEINYEVEQLNLFRKDRLGNYLRYIYSCPLTVSFAELELKEGWDLKLLSPSEIQQGFAYSERAISNKPLGKIHQEILLDFIATTTKN